MGCKHSSVYKSLNIHAQTRLRPKDPELQAGFCYCSSRAWRCPFKLIRWGRDGLGTVVGGCWGRIANSFADLVRGFVLSKIRPRSVCIDFAMRLIHCISSVSYLSSSGSEVRFCASGEGRNYLIRRSTYVFNMQRIPQRLPLLFSPRRYSSGSLHEMKGTAKSPRLWPVRGVCVCLCLCV